MANASTGHFRRMPAHILKTAMPQWKHRDASAIARLLDGHDLMRDEAREAMNTIMSGEATPPRSAASSSRCA